MASVTWAAPVVPLAPAEPVRPVIEDLILRASATVGAIVVVLGAFWWLVGPRVRDFVREQTKAAMRTSAELGRNHGDSMKDRTIAAEEMGRRTLEATSLIQQDVTALHQNIGRAHDELNQLARMMARIAGQMDTLRGVTEETRGQVVEHAAKAKETVALVRNAVSPDHDLPRTPVEDDDR